MEIDLKYPNRVLMDVGLVVCRYGDCLEVGHGSCVAGDGGAHHQCRFRLVVFKPFVDEVCLGKIKRSSSKGVFVSLGFFDDVFIPAHWMLRPSSYEKETGLWVWTPDYDGEDNEATDGTGAVKQERTDSLGSHGPNEATNNRYEMDIGAEIRFKVKSINFTQVTKTAKGITATTNSTMAGHSSSDDDGRVRKRSMSVSYDDDQVLPSMDIVGSICEDGLGLTTWWAAPEEE